MKEPPTNHHRRRLNRKSKNNPKELFNGEDIHKAGNLKDLHHNIIDVDNLHAALLAHNLLGGEQNTKTGGRDILQFCKIHHQFGHVGKAVFQFYNLMQNLTALENVELARQVCSNALNPREVLEQVGLGERMDNFPSQLSGGEQQRVSIARALCKNPALLLCDEPTGALDSRTGEQVLELLTRLCRDFGTTVVMITHNSSIAPLGNKIIRLHNGSVQEVTVNPTPMRVEDIQW